MLAVLSRDASVVVQGRRRWVFETMVMFGATLGAIIVGGIALESVHWAFSLAAFVYLVGAALILAKPVTGLYLIVFLSLIGDSGSMQWYPFDKGVSAAESILFVSDRLVLTPFEGYVVITLIAMLLHRFRTGEPITIRTPVTTPIVLFGVGIGLGLVWGIGTGGFVSIAINQTRAMLVFPILFLLIINLVDRKAARTMLWLALVAITIEAIHAIYWLDNWAPESVVANVENNGGSPVSHPAAIQMSLVLFMLVAVTLLERSPLTFRLALPFMVVPVTWIYIIAQRRAAVGSLIVAFLVLFFILKVRQPRRFWAVFPVLAIVGLAYLGAFWNSTSAIAFPVQAVKSQIVSEASASDASSDDYRVAENFNLLASIRTNPVLGLGFGKPFLTPLPLPDISDAFPLWNFFPHNSTLYLWSSGGILPFWSWLVTVFLGVRYGVEGVLRARRPDDVLLGMVGLSLIVMIAVFNFVDISWDPQTVLLTAFGLGLVTMLPTWIDEDDEADAESADPARELVDSRR